MENVVRVQGIGGAVQGSDEIAADYAGEMIEDQDLLKQFIQKNKENKNVLRRFLEAVKDMASKLTGKYQKQAKDAVALLEKAVEDASRQASKLQASKNTAGKGGEWSKLSAKNNPYSGKSLTENSSVYNYDFLARLPDMNVVEMPPLAEVKTGDKIDRQKAIKTGLENAEQVGRRISSSTIAVTNRYTGRDVRVSQKGLGHSLDGSNIGRLRTNARLTAIGGSIIQNAVPINALKSTNPQAHGTYAMACLLKSGDRNVVSIVTVEQHTDRVTGIDFVDIAHSINGRMDTKKEGSRSSAREPDHRPATTTFGISIADFLEIVNNTHQSILSQNCRCYDDV